MILNFFKNISQNFEIFIAKSVPKKCVVYVTFSVKLLTHFWTFFLMVETQNDFCFIGFGSSNISILAIHQVASTQLLT